MQLLARTPKQIGEDIRRFRKLAHLSQSELGAKANVRQETISAIENGATGTQIQTLCQILNAIDLEFTIGPKSKFSPNDWEKIF